MKFRSAVVLSAILPAVLAFAAEAPKSPEAVFAGLIEEVGALADKYPELADFPEYARRRNKAAAEDAANGAGALEVTFVKNLGEIRTKRGIRPTDFGKHGICLKFEMAPASDPRPAEIHVITELPHSKAKLFAEVHLSENPSPGLEEKLRSIVQRHRQMLIELDERAAGGSDEAKK